ncbi:hypothetical protein ABBQ38_015447 [Trebouxia sp. C0009 RCD-2024]
MEGSDAAIPSITAPSCNGCENHKDMGGLLMKDGRDFLIYFTSEYPALSHNVDVGK